MKQKRKIVKRKPPRRSSIFLKAAREEDERSDKIRRGIVLRLREKLNEKDKEILRLKKKLGRARK